MKFLFGVLFLFHLGVGAISASDGDTGGNDPGGSGILTQEGFTPNDTADNFYYRPWVCYSAYSGYYGWGNYYGYAPTQYGAASNALAICRYNHPYDPYRCVVTGCRY